MRYGKGPGQRLREPRRTGSTGGSSKGNVRGSGSRSDEPGSAARRVDTDQQKIAKLRKADPGRAREVDYAGDVITGARDRALRAGVGATGGLYAAPYYGRGRGYDGRSYGDGYYDDDGYYYNPYCYPWGFTYYGGSFSFGFGYGYWNPCYGYWWPYYVSCWYPYWSGYYRPYWYYGYYYPTVYSTVVYRHVYDVEEAVPVGETATTTVPTSLSTAVDRYLTLGDRAFREGRYTDAVQFYAKAVEFAPEEGSLYLVLADALFASGDYHYGAYAIRRALELDSALVDTLVDKHDFYSDPNEFDRQLETLELYVRDNPTDRDGRLVLALNLLFSGRPAGAFDLLASSASEGLKDDAAAQVILVAAQRQALEAARRAETED